MDLIGRTDPASGCSVGFVRRPSSATPELPFGAVQGYATTSRTRSIIRRSWWQKTARYRASYRARRLAPERRPRWAGVGRTHTSAPGASAAPNSCTTPFPRWRRPRLHGDPRWSCCHRGAPNVRGTSGPGGDPRTTDSGFGGLPDPWRCVHTCPGVPTVSPSFPSIPLGPRQRSTRHGHRRAEKPQVTAGFSKMSLAPGLGLEPRTL